MGLVIELNPKLLNSFNSFDLFMLLMDCKLSYNLIFLFLLIIVTVIEWVVYCLIILNNFISLVILSMSLTGFTLIILVITVFILQGELLHFVIIMVY